MPPCLQVIIKNTQIPMPLNAVQQTLSKIELWSIVNFNQDKTVVKSFFMLMGTEKIGAKREPEVGCGRRGYLTFLRPPRLWLLPKMCV
jgi:hypothetical protein